MKPKLTCIFFLSLLQFSLIFSNSTFAQSPEISLREFASGQIKKGVRTLGMGGDGATSGNYSMVWRDSSTALVDAGQTKYTNGNTFSFTAAGLTTPSLGHGLTIYILELAQHATDIATALKSPGLGSGPVPVHGDGNNQGLFVKAAMPLGKGFFFGLLLSYERAQFTAIADKDPTNYVRYQTQWLPSGGLGLTYQAGKRALVGFRALINQDHEIRTDKLGTAEGLNLSQELRLGISVNLWDGALADLGGNWRHRHNEISGTVSSKLEPNIGFEQNLLKRRLAVRVGLDESSETAGLSIRIKPLILDFVYVHNLGIERVGNLFGTSSDSYIASLLFDFGAFARSRH